MAFRSRPKRGWFAATITGDADGAVRRAVRLYLRVHLVRILLARIEGDADLDVRRLLPSTAVVDTMNAFIFRLQTARWRARFKFNRRYYLRNKAQ